MIEQKIHLKKHELHAERGLPKNCSRLCCNYSEKYQHYSRRISNNIHDGNRVAWSLILSTFRHQTFLTPQKNLLSYYLANKRSLHVHSQGLEILTLIGKNKKIKITHHCHYYPKILLCLIKNHPPMPLFKIKYKISFSYVSVINI
jgi:hypothetical protein